MGFSDLVFWVILHFWYNLAHRILQDRKRPGHLSGFGIGVYDRCMVLSAMYPFSFFLVTALCALLGILCSPFSHDSCIAVLTSHQTRNDDSVYAIFLTM